MQESVHREWCAPRAADSKKMTQQLDSDNIGANCEQSYLLNPDLLQRQYRAHFLLVRGLSVLAQLRQCVWGSI